MLSPIDELACVAASVRIRLDSQSILNAIEVLAAVNLAINPHICTASMSQIVCHVSLVDITVLQVGRTIALAPSL